jgi:two-component system response regulator MprA
MTVDATPNRSAAKVLVAEDDRAVRDALVRTLRVEGYDVRAVADGSQALAAVEDDPPDVLVLDVMMPEVDGLTVTRRIRAQGDRLPVLILTARREVGDRVAGLDAGADDYLPKPFHTDELLARLRALLRRTVPPSADVLRVADLELDPARRTVTRAGAFVDLTKTEFDLLELLMRHAGLVMTREVIYDRIWGFDFETSSRSLDVYVGYLRRKLEVSGGSRLVQTVRGVGYTLRET